MVSGRAAQMARSLASTARSHGLGDDEVSALAGAHSLAMEPRVDVLSDDHHPAYLHPGRSALILLRDVGRVDVSVLVVAALHESLDANLRVGARELEEHVGPAALEALASIPRPGDERLVERLLTLGPGLSLAALAERLDHLRHLHVRADLVVSGRTATRRWWRRGFPSRAACTRSWPCGTPTGSGPSSSGSEVGCRKEGPAARRPAQFPRV